MSHIRDLQKLRETKMSGFGNPTSYNSDFRTTKVDRFKQENYQSLKLNFQKSKDMYNNFLEVKDSSRNKEKNAHKKGLSNNGVSHYDRREQQPSPVLSIHNYSSRPKKNMISSNPLTSRKQLNHHQDIDQYLQYKEYKEGKQLSTQSISKHSFNIYFVIGKGGFGKVWKVQFKKTSKIYAMKEMYKTKIIEKKSVNSVMNERTLLAKLKHNFIVNMTYGFQDRENLYLIMDFLNGGDLRYHIGKRRKFTENQTRFFIVCLLIGLEYLHSNQIIHRDIKPENLVLESNGYLRITDLGISRQWREDNAHDTSGTPGYMAPQVMLRKNHSYPVDYFAVGVMGYQFMLGKRPYLGKNRKQIREQILARQAFIKPDDIPHNWSPQGADFINKLLIRNPTYRLGTNGIDQVKQHPWLKNIDWNRMLKKQIRAPYIPINIQDNYDDYKHQISQDTVMQNQQQNALLLRDKQVQNLFNGYYFDITKMKKTKSTLYTTTNSIVNTQIEHNHNNNKIFFETNYKK